MVANRTRRLGLGPKVNPSMFSSPFAMASCSGGTMSVTSKGVLNEGSSKQGKTLRAERGSICVNA